MKASGGTVVVGWVGGGVVFGAVVGGVVGAGAAEVVGVVWAGEVGA